MTVLGTRIATRSEDPDAEIKSVNFCVQSTSLDGLTAAPLTSPHSVPPPRATSRDNFK